MGNAGKKPGEGESESYGDNTTRLVVTQPQGFAVKVDLKGKLELPPNDVYDLLTHPENHKIFQGIESIVERKVLNDKGRVQKVLLVHKARWKLLIFSGTFLTHMHVEQDKGAGTVSFSLAKVGMMKDFAGFWSVQPYTQQALESADTGSSPRSEAPSKQSKPALANSSNPDRQAEGDAATLCRLEQSILPNITPPWPLDRLLKGIAVKQVRGLMDDLRQEVGRIKAGKATLDTAAGRRFKASLEDGNHRLDQQPRSNSQGESEAATRERGRHFMKFLMHRPEQRIAVVPLRLLDAYPVPVCRELWTPGPRGAAAGIL
ncbi:hypothetical protein WJX74_009061 [Apatococcus lobatus]|uniref:Uncharacterized protein n=1 Tax=Apatococcus lobatus TaxID=904363 RepID=A0AAW1RSP6_9CHLO